MKIMIDTNVFLDVLLEREPFVEASANILSLCEEHKIDGFISASCITDIFYIVRKQTGSIEIAYTAIEKILEIADVCSVTNNDILTAYMHRAKDFEDCLLAVCAEKIKCSYIITRNKKDFYEFHIPPAEPTEFLLQI